MTPNGLRESGETWEGITGMEFPLYEPPEIRLGLVFFTDYPAPNVIVADDYEDHWERDRADPDPDDMFLVLNPSSGSEPVAWWRRADLEWRFERGACYLNPNHRAESSRRDREYRTWWNPLLQERRRHYDPEAWEFDVAVEAES